MILDSHSDKIEYKVFNTTIYFITIFNFLFLFNLSSTISDILANEIFIVNVICSSIFFLEIMFKIIVLKKLYFSDCFNILDFVIVFSGIAEILVTRLNNKLEGNTNFNHSNLDDNNFELFSLRIIRLLRLLRLFSPKSFLGKLIYFIILSIKDLLFYCLMLNFFILMFAIAGRELFSHALTLKYEIDEFGFISLNTPIRENFDSFVESLLTVFILFIGDVYFFTTNIL